MFINYPSIILLALFTTAQASAPVTRPRDLSVHARHIQARAQVVDTECPDGTIFTSADIAAAIRQAKTGQYGRYPVTFTNHGIFAQAPAGELAEFPIMKDDSLFRGTGVPGAYRVIMKNTTPNYRKNARITQLGTFVGVTAHPGQGLNTKVVACKKHVPAAPEPAKPTETKTAETKPAATKGADPKDDKKDDKSGGKKKGGLSGLLDKIF